MDNSNKEKNSKALTEHFFRNEYGKMVSVITRYIGTENVETAEDIVQETLLKAVDFWEQNEVPKNPQAWLYTTAKNLTYNVLKKKKHQLAYRNLKKGEQNLDTFETQLTSDEIVFDNQLKMMFVCCHPSISENSQIALILKILCGFSISEIANAFFSSNETINKRLVRGRKQLRKNNVSFTIPPNLNQSLDSILKTIYLLFNEGYFPSKKHELIRYDLCLEAIRLVKILINSSQIQDKSGCYALLALMYLNASRFEARMNSDNAIIEMEKQDRKKWNQELIQLGIQNLRLATQKGEPSTFLILATISANHCISPSFKETNWKEILSLYDKLVVLENSPITRLNRSVPLAIVKGNTIAINELIALEANSDIGNHHLFHTTLAEFYKRENSVSKAITQLNKAILLATNKRDIDLIKKKLQTVVPN